MSKKEKKEKRPFISKIIIILLFLFLIAIYARYEGTKGILVREYTIVNKLIPESFDGFRIVQFSDLELGTTFELNMVDELVNKINDLEPTIVVFTGDIISKDKNLSSDDKEKLFDGLNIINPLISKYAIRGDDDVDNSVYDELISSCGFIDLTNKKEDIYYKGLTPIIIIGLDSLIKGKQDLSVLDSEETDELYKLLLVHEPDTIIKIRDKSVDLMLSGHSHNSEINIPYLKSLYKIVGATNYYDSEYVVDNTKLYISSGLGTSSLQMRLFSRPSISLFKLYHE